MNAGNTKKEITLDDLAESIDSLAVMTAKGFESVNGRLDKVEGRIEKLETEVQGLRSSVNNYLELSDKRYLELKARQNVIVGWVKEIGDKTGVKINLEDLEKAI